MGDFDWVPDWLSNPPPPTPAAIRGAETLRKLQTDTSHLAVQDGRTADTAAVIAEREKIAAWIECGKDCQFSTASGECRRSDDFCSRYVADCIRRGVKP